jgi:hypothetical protein
MTLLKKTGQLPDELVYNIKSYMPIVALYNLNSSYFKKLFPMILNKKRFPHLIYYNYIGNSCETYIKKILRQDNDYVFKYILLKFGASWKLRIKHRYKSKVFKRYIDYLLFLCVEKYNSTKCKNCLYEISRNEFKYKNINKVWNN